MVLLNKGTNNSFYDSSSVSYFTEDSQLDLFTEDELNQNRVPEDNNEINSNIIPIKKEVEHIIDNNQGVFFEVRDVKFFDINFREDSDNFFINFYISKKSEDSLDKNEPLCVNMAIDRNKKYNNINIKHTEISDMTIRMEIIKTFLTSIGFHDLMSKIKSLDCVSQSFSNFSYHHHKHGTLESHNKHQSEVYKGKKHNLGRVKFSYNHFPELYVLKDISYVNFNKNNFEFKINLEIEKKKYTVSGKGLKTINNSGDHSEVFTHIDITKIYIDPKLEDGLVSQIKDHIIYYIQEL